MNTTTTNMFSHYYSLSTIYSQNDFMAYFVCLNHCVRNALSQSISEVKNTIVELEKFNIEELLRFRLAPRTESSSITKQNSNGNKTNTTFTVRLDKRFDSGLSGREKTTHFGLTECALLRIAANNLKSIYGSIRLDNLTNSTELCDDVETIFNQIQQESRRLGISPVLRSVIDLVCTSNILVNSKEFTPSSSHFDNEAFC
ncbi:unnamed protein product [Rotaria sordida]|uniref:Uncharacterized protein n=1 Tax=Rotaria sordida TaxID=392033 RepID=A0A814H4W9_9BILA|nr:unnamed protein product [Rotaria sordida]CAF3954961.1 unnamed protein product [Rotaria sordida]